MEDPRLHFEERLFKDKCRQRSRKLFRGADSCGIFLFFFLRGMKINYVSCLITLIFNLEGNWESLIGLVFSTSVGLWYEL